MRRTIAAAALVAVLLAGSLFSITADAKDAKGCEGLADYRAAMFQLWRHDGDGRSIMQDRDPLTLSSDDWLLVAETALEYQRALKKIEVPDFAADWHQARIEAIGLAEQMSRAIAKDGFLVALAFVDSIEASEAKEADAVEAANLICADFAGFVHDFDALDGEIDGTPVATPTD